jgi:hypothetical protein
MPGPKAKPSAPVREFRIKRPAVTHPPVRPGAPDAPDVPDSPEPSGNGAGGRFLRLCLWIGLAAWLLFLGFKLLDPLPFLFPGEDDGTYAWWQTRPETVPSAPVETEPDSGRADSPELYALKLKIVAALLRNTAGEALAIVKRQQDQPDIYPYQEDLSELAAFVRSVARMNTTVADAIRERIDQEVVIRVNDRRVKMVPRASAGERVNAVLVSSRGGAQPRSVTFSVSDLDPIERSHWLGQADDPQRCAMKLLLHLEAGDRSGARVFAPNCGILARAFEEQLGSATP